MDNNLIVIQGLEGNPPAADNALQILIRPFIPEIMVFWWCVWIGIFAYVLATNIVLPLWKEFRK